jgi:DNA-binding beta-propeller fold protein YncE
VLAVSGRCSAATTDSTPSGAPVTTSAAPAIATTYAEHHEATIDVQHGDGLATAAGAFWVKTDDGRVVRIDPETNETTGEITVDTTSDTGRYCLGIGTDGESVWACATGDDGVGVAQIDPDTREVVRQVPVDKLIWAAMRLGRVGPGCLPLVRDGTSACGGGRS